MNRYYSNEVDSNETLPLPDRSESEVVLSVEECSDQLPHSIMLYNICKRLMKHIYCRGDNK